MSTNKSPFPPSPFPLKTDVRLELVAAGFGEWEFELDYDNETTGYGVVLVRSARNSTGHATEIQNALEAAGFRVERKSSLQMEVSR